MTIKEQFRRLVEKMPEDRLRQVLDFAAFLDSQEELVGWRQFGLRNLARAYGPNEPEYRVADLQTVR